MLQTLLDWAAATPTIEKVCLRCFAGNSRALSLYRRFGFAEEGRRPRAFKLGAERYDDEVLMYRFVKGCPPAPASC
jgi:RimJ/RimL family protein N-acetyltransferase